MTLDVKAHDVVHPGPPPGRSTCDPAHPGPTPAHPSTALSTTLAAFLLLSSPAYPLAATAQSPVPPPTAVHAVIPGVASTDGTQGSHWQTDVDLTNHDTDANITLCYANNTAPAARDCLQIPIPSGHSVHYTDIGSTLFNKAGTFGVLTATSSADPAKLEARAKTYNLVKDPASPIVGGTLGSSIPVLTSSDLLTPVYSYRVSGAPDVTDFRQNVTLFTTDKETTFTVPIKDQYNNTLSTKTATLPPWSIFQASVDNFFGTSAPDNFIDIDVNNTGAGAYLSIVDNKSNAPTVNEPFIRVPTTIDQYIITSANKSGAAGTKWVTDLTFNNTHNENVQTSVTLLKADTDNATATPQWTELLNQEQRTINDVVGTYLQQQEQYGALRLQSLRPLHASTRSFTSIIKDSGDLGTAGMTIPAMTNGATNKNAAPNDTTNEIVLSINGLREDDKYRSNIMFLNANDRIKSQPVNYTVYDDNGVRKGTGTTTLRRLEMTQNNRLLRDYGLTSGRATISVPQDPSVSDHPNVLAMATVIDNITGQASSHVGYRITITPPPLSLGEQMAKIYFDLLHNTRFYLNNKETYCMLNGCQSVSGIRDNLATELASSPGDIWTPTDYSNWMKQISNNITGSTDLELYHGQDPFTWNTSNAVNFAVVNTQTPPPTFLPGTFGGLTPAATENIFQQVRQFLIDYVNAHPSDYSETTDPTWRISNPN